MVQWHPPRFRPKAGSGVCRFVWYNSRFAAIIPYFPPLVKSPPAQAGRGVHVGGCFYSSGTVWAAPSAEKVRADSSVLSAQSELLPSHRTRLVPSRYRATITEEKYIMFR